MTDLTKFPLDESYERDHRDKETGEFRDWWSRFYDLDDTGDYVKYCFDSPNEADGYWTRRRFALAGWLASRGVQPC